MLPRTLDGITSKDPSISMWTKCCGVVLFFAHLAALAETNTSRNSTSKGHSVNETKADHAKVRPAILWDPSNYLFACNLNPQKPLVVNIRPGDFINFVCPYRDSYSQTTVLNTKAFPAAKGMIQIWETMHVVNKTGYDKCNSSKPFRMSSNPFMTCNEPNKIKVELVEFSENKPPIYFVPGETYYLISTSNRTKGTLGNEAGGSCVGYKDEGFFPLKLQVHICSEKEECYQHACNSTSCYERQCGVWGEWKNQSKTFLWNDDTEQCMQMLNRTCEGGEFFPCEGEAQKLVQVGKENCHKYDQVSTTSETTVTSSKNATTVGGSTTKGSTGSTLSTQSTSSSSSLPTQSTSSTLTPPTPPANVDDSRFFITLVTSLITACVVGACVMHAWFCYEEGRRIEGKVYRVPQYQQFDNE